jgi:HAD superfamily hydrolase (TIGR01549 family)
MYQSYKCILFDVDGVVTSSIPFFTSIFREMAEELGAPKHLPNEFYCNKIGSRFETWLFPIIPEYNHQKTLEVWQSLSQKADNPQNTPLIDGAKDTIVKLYNDGAKIGFISTKPRKPMNDFIEYYNLNGYIGFSICGDEVVNYKPDPEGINKALSYFNINFTDALFVGDSLHDHGAAQNADVSFIGVLTGIAEKQDWENKGIKYIDSIRNLLL